MRSRWLSVAFALVGASLFAISVWVGQWWTLGEIGIGPLGSRNCFGGECRPGGLGWIGGGDLWARSAIATGTAGLVAMVVLLVVAGGFAAGRISRLAAKTALIAIAASIPCAAYFVAKFPGVQGASVGQGAILFALAVVIGSVTPVAVLRRHRPA